MMSDNNKVELLNSYFEIAHIEIAAQIVRGSTVGSGQEMQIKISMKLVRQLVILNEFKSPGLDGLIPGC